MISRVGTTGDKLISSPLFPSQTKIVKLDFKYKSLEEKYRIGPLYFVQQNNLMLALQTFKTFWGEVTELFAVQYPPPPPFP